VRGGSKGQKVRGGSELAACSTGVTGGCSSLSLSLSLSLSRSLFSSSPVLPLPVEPIPGLPALSIRKVEESGPNLPNIVQISVRQTGTVDPYQILPFTSSIPISPLH
jgi:hypothetical protein